MSHVAFVERGRSAGSRVSTVTAVTTRVRDIVLASILLVAFAPLLLIVAISVAVSSPGPIVFRQQRLGRDGVPFTMLKFRTMTEDCDDVAHREFVAGMFDTDGAAPAKDGMFKLTDDERVTGVGRVLRRMSLDEVPQLLNVVAGQMSLVGPRPALSWEVELLEPRHFARFRVKPGLTGLWQVRGRSRLSMPEALELDIEYVRRRSFWLDLGILFRTIPVVLSGRGAS